MKGTPPVNTGRKQARSKDGRFKPGHSGNPRGKPPGARHRATRAAQDILDGEVEGLTRKAVELALDGDTVALRLCLARLVPPRRDSPVNIGLPPIENARSASKALSALLAAVGNGELSPGEAKPVADLIETLRRTLEVEDLEVRLEALEKQLGQEGRQ